MRIAALSREAGVSVATIKYYIREGLVTPGTPTAPNQADYGDEHVHRLRLIRALIDVGGLGVAAVRSVLDAIGDPRLPLHDVLGVAHRSLGTVGDGDPSTDPDLGRARTQVDGFLGDLGWQVDDDHPARRALADALLALWRLGRHHPVQVFGPYAEVADAVAAREVRTLPAESREDAVEAAVVGTVIFEAVLVALRRLAQAHHSALRFARD